MGRETVCTYDILDRRIDVELNWQGKEPEDDTDRFYDLYDADTGEHLNVGEPLHDDGDGVPSREDIESIIQTPNRN